MINRLLLLLLVSGVFFVRPAGASEADDTTITVVGSTAGVTPFISVVNLTTTDTSVIKSIGFSISPKAGSVTRPLAATYVRDYLIERGDLLGSGQIFIPVYGLYDGVTNTVALTYNFLDGSSEQASITITTAAFTDPCGFKTGTVLQPRSTSTALSYDFFLVKDNCDATVPAILDTDGAIRWVAPPAIVVPVATAFFDNAVYRTEGTSLYRVDLDGTITFLHDYSDIGVVDFHHNIDPGKFGLILEADTVSQFEATDIEVDAAGNVLKTWVLADIISAAMTAGGDDPSQFVYPTPTDWFHNNAVTFNRADDSLIVSSRENFLICLDYDTSAIKWILGDPTKKWYEFPSLKQFALTVPAGSLPPIGQHAVSVTFDQDILLFDNGFPSAFQMPFGAERMYASPRRYKLNLTAKTATEIWNFEQGQTLDSPICGSVYEDAPLNYLIDYAFVGGFGSTSQTAQLVGLDSAGNTVFYYQYPTVFCNQAFNSFPLHLESTIFPSVGPEARNLSTRGNVTTGEDTLIGGFIISGTQSKTVALRVLGPSLTGLTGVVGDPSLTVYDSSGAVIAMNDNWQTDPGSAFLVANDLAPSDPNEAATVQSLAPGAYTVIATSATGTAGIGLVEAYDVSPSPDSTLGNISTRGFVGIGDNVLISGFIVGDQGAGSLAVRVLGPSLAPSVGSPLSDPVLTVYDANGVELDSNDNWQEDVNYPLLQENGLAPTNPSEAALVLRPPSGAYTAIVTGAGGAQGVALVEVYNL